MSVLWASIASLAMEGPMLDEMDRHHEPSMKLLKLIEPAYPEEALRLGIGGTVIAELLINKRGLPQKVQIVKGHFILAGAVNNVLHQWRWKPYRLNGEAVEIDLMIAMNFETPQEYANLSIWAPFDSSLAR
jgi:hypothetical protein